MVDARVQPERDERGDPAVAVQSDVLDALAAEPIAHAPVVGERELAEQIRPDQRAAVVGHVLPEPEHVEAGVLEHLGGDLNDPVGPFLHHALDQARLIVKCHAEILHAHQVAQRAEESAPTVGPTLAWPFLAGGLVRCRELFILMQIAPAHGRLHPPAGHHGLPFRAEPLSGIERQPLRRERSNSASDSTGNLTNCGMLASWCCLNSRITMPSWLT